MYDHQKDLEASSSLARIVTPLQEHYEPAKAPTNIATTPDSPTKMASSVEENLVVSDGYNINLGDDDDELFIMSKQKEKGKTGNRFKSVTSAKKGKNGKGKKYKSARAI